MRLHPRSFRTVLLGAAIGELICITAPSFAQSRQAGVGNIKETAMEARAAIAANVADFAFRDEGRWEDLRQLFAPKGTISVSWYHGSIDGFIAASKEMSRNSNALTKHWIGVPRITVCGERALSETDVAIMARSKIGPVEADVTSYARFFDRFEKGSDGVWRILSRTAIYEKDRIDPVAPSILFSLLYRFANFDKYPPQYKHLGYGLERAGFKLSGNIIVAYSAEERAMKQEAVRWSGCLQHEQTRQLPASVPG